MTPAKVLSLLLRINRPAAVFLLTGLAVLAAAAIASSWRNISPNALALFGIYILGFSVITYVLVYIVMDAVLKRILGYFITGIFMCWTSAIFISAVVPPDLIPLPAPVCLIQIFREDCSLKDSAAKEKHTPVARVEPVVAAASGTIRRGDFTVFVQFAGVIVRDDVRAMMTKLETEGWKVEGAQKGGERTAKAAGYNEIRYSSDEDENAAKDLARSVQEKNLTPKGIVIAKTFSVPRRTLEVWISR